MVELQNWRLQREKYFGGWRSARRFNILASEDSLVASLDAGSHASEVAPQIYEICMMELQIRRLQWEKHFRGGRLAEIPAIATSFQSRSNLVPVMCDEWYTQMPGGNLEKFPVSNSRHRMRFPVMSPLKLIPCGYK